MSKFKQEQKYIFYFFILFYFFEKGPMWPLACATLLILWPATATPQDQKYNSKSQWV